MPERDQYDDFLLHCASDMEPMNRLPKSPETFQPQFCGECGAEVLAAHRFCANCGIPTVVRSAEATPYDLPRREIGQLFEVTIMAITRESNGDEDSLGEVEQSYAPLAADSDEEDENRLVAPAIALKLRIANRTTRRIALSLTFAQSALVDAIGRQWLPLEREEHEPEAFLQRWFYLYPKAFVEGTLWFPEPLSLLRHCYISCQPQDREEELFHFILR